MGDRQKYRDDVIKMNGLCNTSKPYHFFYDETNNIAKLRLKNGRLNVSEPQCFALGGIVTSDQITVPELPFFLSLLGLQSSVPELKREYLGKGEFLGILDGQRTRKFLDWFVAQGYFLHYQIVDPLYWGMVDIIDSALDGMDISPQFIILNRGSKADLHRVLQYDLPQTERIFAKYDYPNITPDNIDPFYESLIHLVNSSQAVELVRKKLLTDVFKMGRKKTELVFLGGEEEATLLDSFDKFYAERIMLFENAVHVFDEETRIQERLASDAYQNIIGPHTSYRFVNSKTDMGVQVSDLIIGLMGKYFSFLNMTENNHLLAKLSGLSENQHHNMRSLVTLINRSDTESNGFFHHVISAYLADKQQRVCLYFN